jgi:hypothetical protein
MRSKTAGGGIEKQEAKPMDGEEGQIRVQEVSKIGHGHSRATVEQLDSSGAVGQGGRKVSPCSVRGGRETLFWRKIRVVWEISGQGVFAKIPQQTESCVGGPLWKSSSCLSSPDERLC